MSLTVAPEGKSRWAPPTVCTNTFPVRLLFDTRLAKEPSRDLEFPLRFDLDFLRGILRSQISVTPLPEGKSRRAFLFVLDIQIALEHLQRRMS